MEIRLTSEHQAPFHRAHGTGAHQDSQDLYITGGTSFTFTRVYICQGKTATAELQGNCCMPVESGKNCERLLYLKRERPESDTEMIVQYAFRFTAASSNRERNCLRASHQSLHVKFMKNC